jgi:hypothetical protein
VPKRSSKSVNSIERLLEERLQIVNWLERLTDESDDTPAHIRDKVRHDYEVRLEEVLEKLKGHADKLREALESQQELREELASKLHDEEERLAEAELRHSVGEFDKDKWTQLRTEIRGTLAKNKAKMKVAEKEIGQLEEALDLMEGSDQAFEEFEEETEPVEAQAEEEEYEEEEIVSEDMEEEEYSQATEPRLSSEREAVDELAFLKSVTDDETSGPRPERASAGYESPEPEPSTEEPRAGKSGPGKKARGRESGEKTLKCEECGTLNKPTEWYCERCGAELTSL